MIFPGIASRSWGPAITRPCSAPRPKPTTDPVQLVYAGKLSRAKGVPWLLRALGSLGHLPWRLDLVGGGSGEERDEILELAAALGDRVQLWGPQSQEELARLMGQAHLVVLPSFFEGLPLVVLEALACGCRVVTTALPGVEEVLGGYDTEAILLVPRPRLLGQDTPRPEDEDGFRQRPGGGPGQADPRRQGTAGNRPAGSGGTPGVLFLVPGLCPGGTGLPAGLGP